MIASYILTAKPYGSGRYDLIVFNVRVQRYACFTL
jgi:hypothetical protein